MVNTFMIYGRKEAEPFTRRPCNGWGSYNAWHLSLCFDNDYKVYKAIQIATTKEDFTLVAQRAVIDLRQQCISASLTPADVDELWAYYASDSAS